MSKGIRDLKQILAQRKENGRRLEERDYIPSESRECMSTQEPQLVVSRSCRGNNTKKPNRVVQLEVYPDSFSPK
jgi:hypothetical protein